MALRPTIFKLKIALSDLDRNHYEDLALTVARHPSETDERMMARVLAFCLNSQEGLNFTRGLSSTEEPDLWVRSLDGRISLWIEVGEPSAERIRKASRSADAVRVYAFNTKAGAWWAQVKDKLGGSAVTAYHVDREGIVKLAAMVERTLDLSVTVSEGSAYVATPQGACDVLVRPLLGDEIQRPRP